jgi:hypothetical protein
VATITLCIRYTLDASKLADFETYARNLAAPIERSGGTLIGYYSPTRFAGPTNIALALIDFASLAAYERCRHASVSPPALRPAARIPSTSAYARLRSRFRTWWVMRLRAAEVR